MRRDLTESGFFFDLDDTLGMVGPEESARLSADVERTITRLEQEPMGFQEEMGS